MSFRKHKNRRDLWREASAAYQAEIHTTALLRELFSNEKILDRYLTEGRIDHPGFACPDLSSITDPQFVALESFVVRWYEEMVGGQDYLEAFCRERTKRFGRYG